MTKKTDDDRRGIRTGQQGRIRDCDLIHACTECGQTVTCTRYRAAWWCAVCLVGGYPEPTIWEHMGWQSSAAGWSDNRVI